MRYRTIVADPPWDHSDGTFPIYTTGFGKNRTPRSDGPIKNPLGYPVMTVEEIAELPISELADKDAHLYLWTTNRYLRYAWNVAEAWGFKVASVQVWCKQPLSFQIGGTFQSNLEFFLFARRGSLASTNTVPSSWFTWPRKKGPPVRSGQKRPYHSTKPDAFLDLIESLSPGPYLELFARRNRLGWDTWGNEALNHVAL